MRQTSGKSGRPRIGDPKAARWGRKTFGNFPHRTCQVELPFVTCLSSQFGAREQRVSRRLAGLGKGMVPTPPLASSQRF